MLAFTRQLKLYLFKQEQEVSISIRVSDNSVHTFRLDQENFEQLLVNWQQPDGVRLVIRNNRWFVQYKTRGPRPERTVSTYVRITVSTRDIEYNYRASYQDMIDLEREYYYQKHNTMYWD